MGLWQSTAAENYNNAPWKSNIITKPEDAIKVSTGTCACIQAQYESLSRRVGPNNWHIDVLASFDCLGTSLTMQLTDMLVSLQIAGEAARVAVLGIAPESRADRAAHYVAKSLQDDGVKIVPVPVYYFDVQVSGHCRAASSLTWQIDARWAV